MAVEVILPKVDMDMSTGRISHWHVEEGATVKKGDVLFEIETDKAAMEIEAPASGVVANIVGKEDVDIPVGEAVAWIYDHGEETAIPEAGTPSASSPDVSQLPAAKLEARISQHKAADQTKEGQGEPGGVRASPLARRLAREAGLPLSSIVGSGPKGRVVKADVAAVLAGSSTAGAGLDFESTATFDEGSYDLIPHSGMRRTIARRLVEAKTTIPHFYLTLDCEIDAMLALRRELNEAASGIGEADGETPAFKLSVNDMIIKAFARALAVVPEANVSWTDEAMVRHTHVDLGVAVSVPGGLLTPVVRRAEVKTLSVISDEMKDLVARARARKLKQEDYEGGSAAISNLGMFGIRDFAAIINPPHATILAVGAGEPRPVVKDGKIDIATTMSVTLSTDHRAVDGALAAELLSTFKRIVERPATMLV